MPTQKQITKAFRSGTFYMTPTVDVMYPYLYLDFSDLEGPSRSPRHITVNQLKEWFARWEGDKTRIVDGEGMYLKCPNSANETDAHFPPYFDMVFYLKWGAVPQTGMWEEFGFKDSAAAQCASLRIKDTNFQLCVKDAIKGPKTKNLPWDSAWADSVKRYRLQSLPGKVTLELPNGTLETITDWFHHPKSANNLSLYNFSDESLGDEILLKSVEFKPVLSPETYGLAKAVETPISLATLAAGTTSALGDCDLIDLEYAKTLSVTAECTYDASATGGMRVHLRSSYDGSNFDTVDWDYWDVDLSAGNTVRKTANENPFPRYLKVLLENLDAGYDITDAKVNIAMG